MAPPYVKNPRDSYNDLEPLETIVIGSSAEDGVYKVFVDKWSYDTMLNPSWTNSEASMQKYYGSKSAGTYKPPSDCEYFEFWYVGNLKKSGSSYKWKTINTCTDIKP
jgi:hypothetical protein